MASLEQGECMGCGQPCIGFYCYLCTCQQCGFSLSNGTCINCTFRDRKPVTCCECESPLNGGFCLFCNSRAGNSSAYDPNPNSYNNSPNFSDYTPQPQYDTYFSELCRNDAHYVKHAQSEEVQELLNKLVQDLQSINEELAEYINTPSWNLPTSSYDDDDDEYSFATQEYLLTCSTAITPDSPKTDSLIMVDKHLDIIPETESDKFIKSIVENLVQNPSEFEDECECDMPD
ncbi:hypothetical protein Tco_0877977 [Tanacetum coccineum]|uniref:Uncharacterized protein n=1 Tax=Tanacetum coccineum TaxID=301880 RepID=A0ABQ5BX22_9ASTR